LGGAHKLYVEVGATGHAERLAHELAKSSKSRGR
jgi:hypothetical protein